MVSVALFRFCNAYRSKASLVIRIAAHTCHIDDVVTAAGSEFKTSGLTSVVDTRRVLFTLVAEFGRTGDDIAVRYSRTVFVLAGRILDFSVTAEVDPFTTRVAVCHVFV